MLFYIIERGAKKQRQCVHVSLNVVYRPIWDMRPAATPTIGEGAVNCQADHIAFVSSRRLIANQRPTSTVVSPHIQLLLERSCCALKKEYKGQHPSATSFSSRSLCAAGSPHPPVLPSATVYQSSRLGARPVALACSSPRQPPICRLRLLDARSW
jgi:hypothetical protein